MNRDRPFTNSNAGREVRVETDGREVRLVFVCGTPAGAMVLAANVAEQLKSGTLNMTVMGQPTRVTET